ncbi:MAG: TetR/AcrR family transcriptional regulator [Acutalibacteraceae bacterium]|nr:TetR/AcrR family transcriptional regulator [Acutalibacteraceae bacterium]
MNDKFFELPIEKQRRIINAAYRVFSENSYKKAPMSEIAEEGNISKSLLFHYFTNKKDLYMYLWDNACEITTQAIREYKTLDTDDFFKMLRRTLLYKCSVMRDYPYMYAFSLRAYYETDTEIKDSNKLFANPTFNCSGNNAWCDSRFCSGVIFQEGTYA